MNMPPLAVRPSLTLEKMQETARRLAQQVQLGDIITLKGEVGAGKTTFARALIGALAVRAPDVTSPTYNLMQSYDVKLANGREDTLWHIDLYRLKEPGEVESLGLRELEPHIMLIEWPEIVEAMVPADRLSITFDSADAEAARTLIFRGSESWKHRIEKANI